MDKVFDPSELELADSRGDPGRVVEIQKLIQEFLGANRQRQQGIRAQLLEQGAWALPGLLNATYVWMNQLEDAQSQKLLSSLMADLASDNPAAVDLLFRDGILEAPFSIPRSISRRALDEINWVPDEANSIKLIQAIDKSGELYHTQTVLDLYALLLKRGASQDFSNALTKCKKWARNRWDTSGDLLALLVKQFPERAEQALSQVFLAVRDFYSDEDVADMLLSRLRPIPPVWLEEGVLLKVSLTVLRQMTSSRHTTVEYLWINAARDYKQKKSNSWPTIMKEASEAVQKSQMETLYRYWFRALADVAEIAYIQQLARADDGSWGINAILQLIFQERRNRLAKQALQDLKEEYPSRYDRASSLYAEITGGTGKGREGTQQDTGIGQLTDSAE